MQLDMIPENPAKGENRMTHTPQRNWDAIFRLEMLEHSVSVNVQINSKSEVSSIGFRGLSISSGASNFGIIRTQQKTSLTGRDPIQDNCYRLERIERCELVSMAIDMASAWRWFLIHYGKAAGGLDFPPLEGRRAERRERKSAPAP
ncbi:predicted protein [Histoplasma capsulatum G186AR]|uniref:Uncharacterized protein n=1 Tax=Ajellomyces capsulatus (strain G186AR / H82 / ATCC MYA-2454 / RMSCC 2432) TaxID=447093 RepID=C0NWK7_AJECG|nr:uncharacterized protein HCBG_07537 [Histoplasma capsulatum G186AR]EEH04312.1 predicted protein [Histoplasma capsulatum G186AR]